MPFTQPTQLSHPFAATASGPYITTPIPDSPTGSAHASWQEGFPPITFTDPAAGGSPPFGADFNGVFNYLSYAAQWAQGGMGYTFSSSFATAVGGYPQGALLLSNAGDQVLMALGATSTDPNTATNVGNHWWPAIGQPSVGLARYAATVGGTANGITLTSAIGALNPGTGAVLHHTIYFEAVANNTASVTLAVDGGAAIPLNRSDGAALQASDIVSGTLYKAVLVGSSEYRLDSLAPSQVPVQLFSTVNDVTGSRTLASTYTNSTGKPMWVSVQGATGGTNGDFTGFVNGASVSVGSQANPTSAVGVTIIVPNGATYKVTNSAGSASITKWIEIS